LKRGLRLSGALALFLSSSVLMPISASSAAERQSMGLVQSLPKINTKTQMGIQGVDLNDINKLLRLVSIDKSPEWLQVIKQLETLQNKLFSNPREASLKELVIEALEKNPNLSVAYRSIQSQDALLASAKRQWNPTGSLSASGGYSWQTLSNIPLNQPSTAIQEAPSSSYTNNSVINASIGFNWFPYLATRQPLIRSQKAALDQQRLLFIVTARDTILDTQVAYTAVQKGLALVKAYSDIVETDIAIVDQIEKNKQAGLSSEADVEQQKAQLYQDLIRLINAYAELDAAQSSLGKAIGNIGSTYIIPTDKFIPTGSWDVPLDQTIRQALELREEIKASVQLAESLNWNARKILASYLPSFNISAGFTALAANGIIAQELWGLSPSINKQTTTTPTIAANLTWNFYDGGVNMSLARSQERLAQQALDTARLQETQISADASTSFTDYSNSYLSTISARKAVNAARNATAIYRVRYSLGVDNITTLVLSIKTLSDTTASLATAVEVYNNSVNRLYRNTATWPEYLGVSLSDVLTIYAKKDNN
jgi:outer membrane protein TolC